MKKSRCREAEYPAYMRIHALDIILLFKVHGPSLPRLGILESNGSRNCKPLVLLLDLGVCNVPQSTRPLLTSRNSYLEDSGVGLLNKYSLSCSLRLTNIH